MELEQIKTEILKIYPHWKNTSDSIAGDKDAELKESFVCDLFINYCEIKGTKWMVTPYKNEFWEKYIKIMTKIIFVTNAI